MKQSKVTFNLDGLENLKKAVGNSMRARVGILGNHAARTDEKTGINNAELGLIQMYGSITNNIPPRDFLLMPIEVKKREILKSLSSGQARSAFAKGDYKAMFVILGQAGEAAVMEAFATGGFGKWAPNKESTIKQKGSSAPLIDQGELRKSISSDVVNKSGKPMSVTPASVA
jgi:hypothetical protein